MTSSSRDDKEEEVIKKGAKDKVREQCIVHSKDEENAYLFIAHKHITVRFQIIPTQHKKSIP